MFHPGLKGQGQIPCGGQQWIESLGQAPQHLRMSIRSRAEPLSVHGGNQRLFAMLQRDKFYPKLRRLKLCIYIMNQYFRHMGTAKSDLGVLAANVHN